MSDCRGLHIVAGHGDFRTAHCEGCTGHALDVQHEERAALDVWQKEAARLREALRTARAEQRQRDAEAVCGTCRRGAIVTRTDRYSSATNPHWTHGGLPAWCTASPIHEAAYREAHEAGRVPGDAEKETS